jgi:hypothetical protein
VIEVDRKMFLVALRSPVGIPPNPEKLLPITLPAPFVDVRHQEGQPRGALPALPIVPETVLRINNVIKDLCLLGVYSCTCQGKIDRRAAEKIPEAEKFLYIH